MNYRFVIHQLGLLLLVLSVIVAAVAGWEEIDWRLTGGRHPSDEGALLATAAIGALFGAILLWLGRKARHDLLGRREALLLVGTSWFLGAAVAALPYYLWAQWREAHPSMTVPEAHPFHRYIDCYFEAMSGLTTTGATVLADVEALPRGLLLWRALTQWLGGLGIVVLFVAVLPTVGIGGKRLFVIEMAGPAPSGVRPRIREAARKLWMLYTGLTIAVLAALMACGMDWFDALCHACSTLAIGGFSPRNGSIGAYGSTAVNVVTVVFMIIAGVNFGLYYQIMRGSVRAALKDTELRVYLCNLLLCAAVVIGALLVSGQAVVLTGGGGAGGGPEAPAEPGRVVEHGLFNAVSLTTTTGFCTADYDQWPFAARAALVVAMIIGGCAGSTAGGLKVIRFWTALRVIFTELEHLFRPQVVRPTRVGGVIMDSERKLSVLAYILAVAMLLGGGSIALGLLESGNPACDYPTALSAAISTAFNIGPGFGGVGPTADYGWFGPGSKVLLSLMMALGRLELFGVLVLLMPRFWQVD